MEPIDSPANAIAFRKSQKSIDSRTGVVCYFWGQAVTTFLFQGLSGKGYLYSLAPWHDPSALTLQRGTYLFAKGSADAPTPVFIDEANNLRAAVAQALVPRNMAQSIHGADLLFIHIEPDPEERLDLVAGYQPVMNVATAYEE